MMCDRIALALCVVVFGVIVFTFQVPGVAWDDHFQSRYGDLILTYIESGFEDRRVLTYANLSLYGGLFDAIAQFLVRLSPFAPHDTRHLFSALVGLVGLIGTWRFAHFLSGSKAGLLALVLLMATPSYVGHMFINIKDIPFAAAFIWSLYLAVRAAATLPNVPPQLALGLGIALGCTLGVRIGGVLVLAYMGILLIQHYVWFRARGPVKDMISEAAIQAKTVLLIVIPAFVLTFVLWPGAWANPLLMAYVALAETAKFHLQVDVLLNGVYHVSTALPAHYLATYFALKLPEVLVLGLIVGVPVLIAVWLGALKKGNRPLGFGITALLLGVFFPFVYVLVAHSAHYDAIRHFLFVLPPMAVMTAMGLVELWAWLKGRNVQLTWVVGACVGVGVLISAGRMVTLFPYTYASFNAFAGGIAGAQGRYETDYWALSYKDAAIQLSHAVASDAPYTVFVCGPQPSVRPFLDRRARLVDDVADADFLICFTRWNFDERIQAPLIAEVNIGGAQLAVVKDLRSGFDIVGKKPKTLSLEPEN